MSKFLKISKVRGHGDWAIFEGFWKCSCCLTGTRYTASTGIVVFKETHSTSPCTKLMKFEMSKFLKISKVRGHGDWAIFEGFLKCSCWLTGTRYTASTGIVVFTGTHSTSPCTKLMKFEMSKFLKISKVRGHGDWAIFEGFLKCSCWLTGTRYTASTGIVVFTGTHSTSPCTKLMKFEMSRFLKISKVRGHGDWAIFEGFLKCSCWLTGTRYTASTGIVVFKETHSTSPCTKLMKFEMSKFLKISKVRGHGDWAIFEGFLKCSCWLTGTRYTASTGIVVFTGTHSTSPCTKLMKFEMSKFLKISKVRGHGDWAIFEGFLKCSCCLTGTRYTASTGIVVFKETHSTSPCTKLMKFEMSKFLKISKVRGHGDWAIFEGFLKCSCWLTGTRYTASTGIVVFTGTHSTSPCTKLMKFEMSKFLKISKVRGHGDWAIFEGFLKCSCWLTGTRYTASTGIVVFTGTHSTSPCTKLMKFEMSKFLKISKVRGHGDWAIFEGFWKCSCCLTGTRYTASTGIVVFKETHSTSPCTKLMKFEMSKFLKISKVRGHGDWAIFEGFLKCSCWLTGTRYTASTGIVVFTGTHSTSPCTKLMKFEMSKFLKISKVRGHGDWAIFEGFWKCSCWLTGTRYTASTGIVVFTGDPLYKSMH